METDYTEEKNNELGNVSYCQISKLSPSSAVLSMHNFQRKPKIF